MDGQTGRSDRLVVKVTRLGYSSTRMDTNYVEQGRGQSGSPQGSPWTSAELEVQRTFVETRPGRAKNPSMM